MMNFRILWIVPIYSLDSVSTLLVMGNAYMQYIYSGLHCCFPTMRYILTHHGSGMRHMSSTTSSSTCWTIYKRNTTWMMNCYNVVRWSSQFHYAVYQHGPWASECNILVICKFAFVTQVFYRVLFYNLGCLFNGANLVCCNTSSYDVWSHL